MSALDKVEITIAVAIGGRDMTVSEVLGLHRGALIELTRAGHGKGELRVGDCAIGLGNLELIDGAPIRVALPARASGGK